jgi:hypothetical protein
MAQPGYFAFSPAQDTYISTNAYLHYAVPFGTSCYVRLVLRSVVFLPPLMILID